MKTNNELIDEYYRNNPDQEVRDRRSTILEVAGPMLAGAGLGASGALSVPSRPTSGAGLGAAIAVPTWAVRKAHRRKKILNEMGVDESILGSFLEPIKREI